MIDENYMSYDCNSRVWSLCGKDYPGTDTYLNFVEKGWGSLEHDDHAKFIGEVIFKPFFRLETAKLLYFAAGKKLSKHFHVDKAEIFYLVYGELEVKFWDKQSKLHEFALFPGDSVYVPRGLVHQMIGVDDSAMLEVSTLDTPSDSYRIEKGD